MPYLMPTPTLGNALMTFFTVAWSGNAKNMDAETWRTSYYFTCNHTFVHAPETGSYVNGDRGGAITNPIDLFWQQVPPCKCDLWHSQHRTATGFPHGFDNNIIWFKSSFRIGRQIVLHLHSWAYINIKSDFHVYCRKNSNRSKNLACHYVLVFPNCCCSLKNYHNIVFETSSVVKSTRRSDLRKSWFISVQWGEAAACNYTRVHTIMWMFLFSFRYWLRQITVASC